MPRRPCGAESCRPRPRSGQALDIGSEPAFTKSDESYREVNSQETPMNMSRGSFAEASLESPPAHDADPTAAAAALASLVVDLQARGLTVEVPLERRSGGAGPSDSGMLWVGGIPITVPTDNTAAANSPYVLKAEDDGYAIFEGDRRLAGASTQRRPRFYDLSTA